MSSANFTPIPAKAAFGTMKPILFANDVTVGKSIVSQFCPFNTKTCNTNYKLNNSGDLLAFKKYYRYKNNFYKPYNTSNLNVNLYTKLDLRNVDVLQANYPVETPTKINPSINFNENYTIDPKGELFGNSNCGINNYVKFQTLNCQTYKC